MVIFTAISCSASAPSDYPGARSAHLPTQSPLRMFSPSWPTTIVSMIHSCPGSAGRTPPSSRHHWDTRLRATRADACLKRTCDRAGCPEWVSAHIRSGSRLHPQGSAETRLQRQSRATGCSGSLSTSCALSSNDELVRAESEAPQRRAAQLERAGVHVNRQEWEGTGETCGSC